MLKRNLNTEDDKMRRANEVRSTEVSTTKDVKLNNRKGGQKNNVITKDKDW